LPEVKILAVSAESIFKYTTLFDICNAEFEGEMGNQLA